MLSSIIANLRKLFLINKQYKIITTHENHHSCTYCNAAIMPCANAVWVLHARPLGGNGSFRRYGIQLLCRKQERTCGYIRRIGITVSTVHKDCVRPNDMEHR